MITEQISPGNESLLFLDRRLRDKDYRGLHLSQHNRFDFEKVYWILSRLFETVGTDKMQIRTDDISRRPKNSPGEAVYAKFCEEAKDSIGIGTQDAMRKNLFVDLHRMGLLNRYSKKGDLLEPFRRSSAKYVSISEEGIRLVKASAILTQYFIYSKALNTLLQGLVETYIEILQLIPKGRVSVFEHLFFVSAIDSRLNYAQTRSEVISLIESFRTLSRTQQNAVIDTVKQFADPKINQGSKQNKQRDFHNWKNEAQQQFSLLGQTVYFEQRDTILTLRLTGQSAFDPKRLQRSLREKQNYFNEHGVSKAAGFELHHIVPLAWAESLNHFKLLDVWKNMVYIDAFHHAVITQNNNRNSTLKFFGKNAQLSDLRGSEVDLTFETDIKYLVDLQDPMLEYNEVLNKSIPPSG